MSQLPPDHLHGCRTSGLTSEYQGGPVSSAGLMSPPGSPSPSLPWSMFTQPGSQSDHLTKKPETNKAEWSPNQERQSGHPTKKDSVVTQPRKTAWSPNQERQRSHPAGKPECSPNQEARDQQDKVATQPRSQNGVCDNQSWGSEAPILLGPCQCDIMRAREQRRCSTGKALGIAMDWIG